MHLVVMEHKHPHWLLEVILVVLDQIPEIHKNMMEHLGVLVEQLTHIVMLVVVELVVHLQ